MRALNSSMLAFCVPETTDLPNIVCVKWGGCAFQPSQFDKANVFSSQSSTLALRSSTTKPKVQDAVFITSTALATIIVLLTGFNHANEKDDNSQNRNKTAHDTGSTTRSYMSDSQNFQPLDHVSGRHDFSGKS